MIKKIFVLTVIFSVSLFPQKEEKIVASVGPYNIYESEFKERFDFSVHPRLLQTSDRDRAKHEFLEQLIAEKLLSLEAQGKGYDTLPVYNDIITPLNNMFIRDALYIEEIKKKVSVPSAEINEGVSRINKILKLTFIHSKELQELNLLYKSLKAGASFDSVLSTRKEAEDQASPREVTFGTMDKEIEDEIYSLKPGEITPPLQSKDGYYILKLVSIEKNPSLKDRDMVLEDVRRIVKTRKEYDRYLDFYHKFFAGHKISADKEIFEALVREFVRVFTQKYPYLSADSAKFTLTGTEVTSVLPKLDPELKEKTFITIEKKSIRPEYFLNQLSHTGFHVQYPRELSIRSSLSSYIRKFIEDELLTSEGISRKLDNNKDVKKYINMWGDSYLSKMLMMNIFDSVKVSDEEAYTFFNMNEGKDVPFQWVNIAEVLTDSLQVIETVLNELSKGKSIKELARQYTKRDSLKDKGGEFGFFPATMHGELGKIASKLDPGEIYGPVKLDEGYSLFQVLDKKVAPLISASAKADTGDNKAIFEELKEQIIMQLTLNKFEKHVNEYNASLARKYEVKINADVLNNIENSFLNLVVVRYMGFGGQIFAVPYTEQFSGWYKIWKEDGNLNP